MSEAIQRLPEILRLSEGVVYHAAADEIDRLRSVLADLLGLAEAAMRAANRDGAEYDIDGELAEARAALNH